MGLKFKNFLKIFYFTSKFSQKAPYEGLIFVFWCFCDPTWDSSRSKKYPDQWRFPVPFFAQVDPPGTKQTQNQPRSIKTEFQKFNKNCLIK